MTLTFGILVYICDGRGRERRPEKRHRHCGDDGEDPRHVREDRAQGCPGQGARSKLKPLKLFYLIITNTITHKLKHVDCPYYSQTSVIKTSLELGDKLQTGFKSIMWIEREMEGQSKGMEMNKIIFVGPAPDPLRSVSSGGSESGSAS